MTCDRCDRLEEEVAYLKSELGLQVAGDQIGTVMDAFKVTDQKARILLILHGKKGKLVRWTQFVDALPPRYGDWERSDKLVHSSISQLRKIVGKGAIETLYGTGYRLSEEMRARMDTALARSPIHLTETLPVVNGPLTSDGATA